MTGGDWMLVGMGLFGGLVLGGLLGFALRDHLADLIARDWETPARWDLRGR